MYSRCSLCDIFFFQITRLFAFYHQAETHRKAPVIHKQYLQCQVDAFFQIQQSALLMVGAFGLSSLPIQVSSCSCPFQSSRLCCHHYVLILLHSIERKMQHLRSQINKLQRHAQKSSPLYGRAVASTLTATVATGKEHRASSKDTTNARQPSPVGPSTGI